jgi:hypothetical protein
MPRIQIEDLLVETLTPEEMEEILGAGRFSFQPTFEALEERQLMAAGFGGASLGSIMAQHKMQVDALIRQVSEQHAQPVVTDTTLNTAEVDTGLRNLRGSVLQGQSQFGATEADGKKVFDEVKSRFGKQMVDGEWNRWLLQDIKGESRFELSGTNITVHLKVGFGFWGASSGWQKTMDFKYEFANHGNQGGASVYKLVSATHDGYEGLFKDKIDGKGREVMAGDFKGLQIYDPNAGKLDHSRAENATADRVRDYFKNARDGNYVTECRVANRCLDGFSVYVEVRTKSAHWSEDDNPNFRIQTTGKLTLQFKYEGMVNGAEQYTCTGVEGGVRWRGTAPNRNDATGDASLADLGVSDGRIKTDFTNKKVDLVPTPNGVKDAVFTQAQKLLSQDQFKNFKLTMVEELDGGVRLKIHADRADGKGVDFSVDARYDGSRGYKCDRVSVDLHGDYEMSAQEVSGMGRLLKDLHGHWRATDEEIQQGKDRAALEKALQTAGQKFGERVVQSIAEVDLRHPDYTHVDPLRSGVSGVERTADGVRVNVWLSREVRVGEHSILSMECKITFDLKYEGRSDGVDRFSLVKVSSNYTNSFVKGHDLSMLQAFGVSNESLQKQFASFSIKAAT